MAEPKLGGRSEATSRRMRVASLQPLPEVVMPICKGPSEWVAGRLKVQRLGLSRTLTGIRFRRHRVEMCVRVSKDSFPPRVTKTASTTFSMSSLPNVVRSSSSNPLLSHSTWPVSILFSSA